MLFPSVNNQKAYLTGLLTILIGLNLYLHFTFEGTLEDRANWLDSIFGKVLVPVQMLWKGMEGGVTSSVGAVGRLYNAERENERLKAEIVQKDLELQDKQTIVAENNRFREMLEFRDREPHQFLAAKIVARDPSVFFRSIEINRGSADGVEPSMAVVAGHGIVGRILRASSMTSTVLLITDVNSKIEAVSERSNTRVIIGGSPEGDLTLRYLPRRWDIRQGDELVTSGLGGFFPSGFRIGQLIGLAQDPNLILQQAELEPAVDFENLTEVFVVLKVGTNGGPRGKSKT